MMLRSALVWATPTASPNCSVSLVQFRLWAY
ncbi:unnamed protein product [Callosobruchus maculatus]|uniref:Uncharacterized protein n=1 Tax=Callosobruchus maculatus TaxID=64391 RepID=A0A653CYX2_CALMS|nr:unnamed protein product [Callosobruchus maculatus]